MEKFTRWAMTKQNNLVAIVLFPVILFGTAAAAIVAYVRTNSLGPALIIVFSVMGFMALVLIALMMLGLRYGIEPATRRRDR